MKKLKYVGMHSYNNGCPKKLHTGQNILSEGTMYRVVREEHFTFDEGIGMETGVKLKGFDTLFNKKAFRKPTWREAIFMALGKTSFLLLLSLILLASCSDRYQFEADCNHEQYMFKTETTSESTFESLMDMAKQKEAEGCNILLIKLHRNRPVDTVYRSSGMKGVGLLQVPIKDEVISPPKKDLQKILKEKEEWENTVVTTVDGIIVIEGENPLTRSLRQ